MALRTARLFVQTMPTWGIPHNPLFASSASALTFTVEFAEALGKAVHEKIDFQEIAFEVDAPKLLKQMPNGGVGCQDIGTAKNPYTIKPIK